MKASIRLAPVCFALAGVLMVGCGRNNDDREAAASSTLASDSSESEAAVSSSFNETMDAMSDSNLSSSQTSLALSADLDIKFDVSRNCEAADGKAAVTIGIDKEASWERSNARIQVSATSTIENNIVRTWSKDGATVGCTVNAKFAAIDFEADLSGYALDVTIDRTADRSVSRTVVRTGVKTTQDLQSTIKGTRHVKWTAETTEADGSISRSKTISFSVDRNDSYLNKDGDLKELALSVATTADLNVTVVWDTLAKNRQLLSKLIKSGTVKGTAANGSVEASFSNVLLKFSATSCEVYSGSMEAKIYAEGSTTAAKTYLLTAAAGTITVKDTTDPANPQDVDDFDYSPCDIKDFSY